MSHLEVPHGQVGEPGSARARFLFGNQMSTPIRLAYGLGPLIQVLEEAGHAVGPLLAAAEIPAFALEEPSYRIRVEQEIRFTRLAVAELARCGTGLAVGQRYHMVMFGVLGLAAASAPSVYDLFRTILSYPVLAWGMSACSLWNDRGHGVLVLDSDARIGDCVAFFVERDLTCAVTVLRDTLGAQCAPRAVHFAHPAPADSRPYTDYFRCPVRFAASANELHFDAAIWQARPPQANTMSYRFFENQCRRVSDMLLEPLNYTDIVRRRLHASTPLPSLAELSASLQLTARTVQRRLADEGSSFTGLLREVRLEQARDLLRRPDIHIDEIAYRLGFEDPVSFSHAFKAWTGVAPRDYRETLVKR